MIAGGGFTSADTTSSPNWARWTDTGALWIARHPESAQSCGGSPATFTVDGAIGTGPFTYRWRHNGLDLFDGPQPGGAVIASADTDTLTVTFGEAMGAGDFDCVVSNACGSATSHAASLTSCTADFNCSGTVSVQDIFDFLAAYFAGDMSADVNGSGVVSVQDIFDYPGDVLRRLSMIARNVPQACP